MLTEIRAARLLTYAAASYYDQQVEHKLDTAAAKVFAIQVAERCASACLQIHGGWGLIEGVHDDVVRNFMDSRSISGYDGQRRGAEADYLSSAWGLVDQFMAGNSTIPVAFGTRCGLWERLGQWPKRILFNRTARQRPRR